MSQPNPIIHAIQAHLQAVLPCDSVEIIDETAQHTTHASYTPGKYHIRIIIHGSHLRNLPRITAHRAVYAALDQWLPRVLHAVAIECK
jgi:BolA protein